MIQEDTQEQKQYFKCDKCNYVCYRKGDWNKHNLTTKHKRPQNDTTNSFINNEYNCECGKNINIILVYGDINKIALQKMN